MYMNFFILEGTLRLVGNFTNCLHCFLSQVLLKGPAVTKGYYKEPQKTAELFDAVMTMTMTMTMYDNVMTMVMTLSLTKLLSRSVVSCDNSTKRSPIAIIVDPNSKLHLTLATFPIVRALNSFQIQTTL